MACEKVRGAKSAQVGGDVGLTKGDYEEGETSESLHEESMRPMSAAGGVNDFGC
jgi:hypothetical protein